MAEGFFFQALIYLAAAVICVPIAKKLGLSSILGYLFAGIIIGPYVLGFIGQEGQDIMHFAEFGVVMMLFLIGLELEPHKFWRMRRIIIGMGSLQVLATTTVLFIACSFVLRWHWQETLAISLALTLSSTAIVMQTLKEKGLTNTSMGRSSFAVLLFQDIAVIPIMAILPLIAGTTVVNESNEQSLISHLGWIQAPIVLGTIGFVYLGGRFIIIPLLHVVARTRLQELFTASALLLVMSVSFMMQLVGLSPALGAFLAGLVLANSEFRHELEGDIAPFKGLLLGLFFIGVGASIDFRLIMADPAFIIIFSTIFNTIKFFVLLMVGKIYKKSSDQNILFSFALSQAGEFGFVILSFAIQLGLMQTELANQMMAVIALSMIGTPFLLLINERFIDPFFGVKEKQPKNDYDDIDENNDVIIAGFGNFGSTIVRLLKTNGIPATVLDMDSDRVDSLRKMGFKVYYGDASRLELLKAAGCDNAKLFIAAIDNPRVNLQVVEMIKKHFPNLKILARARNRSDAFELVDMGVHDFYRENLYSAVHLGVDALVELGHRRYTATRQGQRFMKYDEQSIHRLAEKRHDKKAFLMTAKEEIELQEHLLKNDLYAQLGANDHAWESADLRREAEDNSEKKED
ncbi:monovalent cation:proton antiporter-2 (CPA2) family protein [Flavobacterium sp. MFBS3-15]|uniref:monovalent cation:proton antiporter-2 (CPA2) family protein n=1 Tax=Flavobacterium sp. MFBS3-15 TaxID=2989816 RepID=UPI0022357F06|nr:monovalent cation:proton antiporter-2 (CPA2) family protein [Flavobacterium sp. MFBS3-15]MCW4468045.1 monovalent cation:proton antiporter-2 (CPA2) family protein [Flavobacterium sp. MFBS3-15]